MTEKKKPLPALSIEQLTVNYEKTPVLWDLSFDVPKGGLVGIIGPNGAGKSTLIKTVLGLIKPLSGKIEFFGNPISSFRKKISYVPQKESVDWDFPITVFDLVLMGSYGKLGLLKRPGKKEKERAWEKLKEVGMEGFAKRQIDELSGGQKQRVFIARALMQEAEIYFMDEPLAGIDVSSTQVIFALLQKLQKEGKTIFIVHHDLQSVPLLFSWVILLNMSLIASGPVSEVFIPELIDKTYGKDKKVLDQVARLANEKTSGTFSAS